MDDAKAFANWCICYRLFVLHLIFRCNVEVSIDSDIVKQVPSSQLWGLPAQGKHIAMSTLEPQLDRIRVDPIINVSHYLVHYSLHILKRDHPQVTGPRAAHDVDPSKVSLWFTIFRYRLDHRSRVVLGS